MTLYPWRLRHKSLRKRMRQLITTSSLLCTAPAWLPFVIRRHTEKVGFPENRSGNASTSRTMTRRWRSDMTKRTCIIDGCGRPTLAITLCSPRYWRFHRHGSTAKPIRKSKALSLTAFKRMTQWQGSCLIFTGTITPFGYGRVGHNGRRYPAHRWVWIYRRGPIADDFAG